MLAASEPIMGLLIGILVIGSLFALAAWLSRSIRHDPTEPSRQGGPDGAATSVADNADGWTSGQPLGGGHS
jgi:hypothetical protein